ncbi:MAG: hypothetical protein C0600_02845 [Ignavibacteria bacterium]|nr:MAG: hypothetical protein C0600_02845 [Ignavibacteria bacterium]
MTRSTALMILLLVFGMGTKLSAQTKAGDVTFLIQGSGSITDLDDDFHDLGSGTRHNTDSRISSYYLSINPTWWLGEHTAIELELGHRWMSVKQSCVDGTCYQKLSATLAIPHVLLSFAALDSVLVPYVKGGIGLYSVESMETPIGYSLGAGAMFFATRGLFFRGEVNFRGHYSESGRSVLNSLGVLELKFLAGVGWKI